MQICNEMQWPTSGRCTGHHQRLWILSLWPYSLHPTMSSCCFPVTDYVHVITQLTLYVVCEVSLIGWWCQMVDVTQHRHLSLPHFDGLVQEKRNSIANALDLHLFCINLPMLYMQTFIIYVVSGHVWHTGEVNRVWTNEWSIHEDSACEHLYMGQVLELWLSCYLVLLSIDSKTR